MLPIVLASTSPYRRELLARLRLPFTVEAPEVDEATLPAEAPAATARRLARAKAQAVARRQPRTLVIGSDQVADLDGRALGKPGAHDVALRQLQELGGRTVDFHTALAVVHGDAVLEDVVVTTVSFRRLPEAVLDAYLRLDTPYDCAGSARVESLGIALLERVRSDDPSALIGLPLIRLVSMLAACGIAVPAP